MRGASRFAYGTVTLCGAGFHRASATLGSCARRRSYNPGRGHKTAPVWANARSLATTCAIIVIFSSSGYLDVSVPRVRPPRQTWCGGIAPAGFPHSDIRGSQGICPSPRLFAACHVLRRLREPQASPMRPFILSLFLQARDARQCRRPVPHELPPDRFRSIALSTRFLASILYSSRSQHVNDLFLFSLGSPRQT